MQRKIIDGLDLRKYTQNLNADPQNKDNNFLQLPEIPSQNIMGRKGCVTISVLKEGSDIGTNC